MNVTARGSKNFLPFTQQCMNIVKRIEHILLQSIVNGKNGVNGANVQLHVTVEPDQEPGEVFQTENTVINTIL